jgi:acetyl esterase/lipase
VAPSFGVRGYGLINEQMVPRPTYLLAGGQDRGITQIRDVVVALESAGIPIRFDERPDMGHDWPGTFNATLRDAVDWILGNR